MVSKLSTDITQQGRKQKCNWGRARSILTHQARFKICVFEISMSIKIQAFSQKILFSIKIQDFLEQSFDFKQDPRMSGNLEFEKDSR